MTRDEFDAWTADLSRKFPAIHAWLDGLGNATAPLLADWCDVLASCALPDALAANRRLLAGDEDGPGKFPSDWQGLPAKVRSLVRSEQQGRPPAPSARNDLLERDYRQPEAGFNVGKLFQRLVQLKDLGVPADEAKAQALAEFPVGNSPFREPRYACLQCEDMGRVLIASPSAIRAALLGKFDKCHHREAVARCRCRVGMELKRKTEWITYDPAWDYALTDTLWSDASTLAFLDWVSGQREQDTTDRSARFVWKPPPMPDYSEAIP
jgi:hypothetical protein